jgi:biotin synthase
MTPSTDAEIRVRHDWTRAEVQSAFDLPLPELMFRAMAVHRAVFDPAEVQLSQLLSVKTGGCAEDCGYCSQSIHFDTGLKAARLMAAETVIAEAARARARGAQRFCMGAAWRELKDRDLPELARMISGVKALGLETCATLGMLTPEQAIALRGAGLDYYNHNLDTAPEDYARIVSTRTYDERLDTLAHVREAGINVCCGGIVGIDGLEFVRTIAVARIVCPRSVVRLAAGRQEMSRELQAMCLMAGANSIFIGEKLLTTPLPGEDKDRALLAALGMRPMGEGSLGRPAARPPAAQ